MALYPITPDRITNSTITYSTNIVTFENGAEQRSSNAYIDKQTFKLSHKYLTTADMLTLKNFFKSVRGAYGSFEFYNHIDGQTYTVRFKDDEFPEIHTNAYIHSVDIEVVTC